MIRPLDRWTEQVRQGAPLPLPLAALLSSLTPLTRMGMWTRRLHPPLQVDAHVISMGNITAGGTGKTPAVIERAQVAAAQGERVAVLTRGYGAPSGKDTVVVQPGEPGDDVYSRIGDEAALIRRRVPEVCIVKSPDRAHAAQLAVEKLGCSTLILDDGFQYLRLARDEDVVVVDATNPYGNGHLLPRGILREPVNALSRATHIILTRCDQAENPVAVAGTIRRHNPTAPIRYTRHAPTALWSLATNAHMPVEDLIGKPAGAVCAIGNPEAFWATLRSLGVDLVATHHRPDHRPITPESLPPTDLIITTEKDAMRMPNPDPRIWALRIDLVDWTP